MPVIVSISAIAGRRLALQRPPSLSGSDFCDRSGNSNDNNNNHLQYQLIARVSFGGGNAERNGDVHNNSTIANNSNGFDYSSYLKEQLKHENNNSKSSLNRSHMQNNVKFVQTYPQPVSEDPVLGLTVTFRDALSIEVPAESAAEFLNAMSSSPVANANTTTASILRGPQSNRDVTNVPAMRLEFFVVVSKNSLVQQQQSEQHQKQFGFEESESVSSLFVGNSGGGGGADAKGNRKGHGRDPMVLLESAGAVPAVALSKRWLKLEPLGGEGLIAFSVCRVEHVTPLSSTQMLGAQQRAYHAQLQEQQSALTRTSTSNWAGMHKANIEDDHKRAIAHYRDGAERVLRVRVLTCEGLALPISQSSRLRWFATFNMERSAPSRVVMSSAHYHPIAGGGEASDPSSANSDNCNNNNSSVIDTAFFHRASWSEETDAALEKRMLLSNTSRELLTPDGNNNNNNSEPSRDLVEFLVKPNNCSTELKLHIEVLHHTFKEDVDEELKKKQQDHDDGDDDDSSESSDDEDDHDNDGVEAAATVSDVGEFLASVSRLRKVAGQTSDLHGRTTRTEIRSLRLPGTNERFSHLLVEVTVAIVDATATFQGLPLRSDQQIQRREEENLRKRKEMSDREASTNQHQLQQSALSKFYNQQHQQRIMQRSNSIYSNHSSSQTSVVQRENSTAGRFAQSNFTAQQHQQPNICIQEASFSDFGNNSNNNNVNRRNSTGAGLTGYQGKELGSMLHSPSTFDAASWMANASSSFGATMNSNSGVPQQQNRIHPQRGSFVSAASSSRRQSGFSKSSTTKKRYGVNNTSTYDEDDENGSADSACDDDDDLLENTNRDGEGLTDAARQRRKQQEKFLKAMKNSNNANRHSGFPAASSTSYVFDSLPIPLQSQIEQSISAAVDNAVGQVMNRMEDLFFKLQKLEDRISNGDIGPSSQNSGNYYSASLNSKSGGGGYGLAAGSPGSGLFSIHSGAGIGGSNNNLAAAAGFTGSSTQQQHQQQRRRSSAFGSALSGEGEVKSSSMFGVEQSSALFSPQNMFTNAANSEAADSNNNNQQHQRTENISTNASNISPQRRGTVAPSDIRPTQQQQATNNINNNNNMPHQFGNVDRAQLSLNKDVLNDRLQQQTSSNLSSPMQRAQQTSSSGSLISAMAGNNNNATTPTSRRNRSSSMVMFANNLTQE